MRVFKVPVIDGKPQWSEGEWDHQGPPCTYMDQLTPVEVRFIESGLTVGINRFLWASDDVQLRGPEFQYMRLGFRPTSKIGGTDGKGKPWMLLSMNNLGRLFQCALRENTRSQDKDSSAEAQLKEELVDAIDARDHYRAEYWRLSRQYEQLQGYIGELLSEK